MDKILQSVNSGEWWFSVVIVGVLVGIVGTFAVRGIDSLSARMGGAWANRSKAAQAARSEMVGELMRFRHRIPFILSERNNLQIEAVWSGTLGAMVIVLGQFASPPAGQPVASLVSYAIPGVFGILGVTLFIQGFRRLFSSMELTLALIELRGRLDVEQIRNGN